MWLAGAYHHRSDPLQPENKEPVEIAGEDAHSCHNVHFHPLVLMNALHRAKYAKRNKER